MVKSHKFDRYGIKRRPIMFLSRCYRRVWHQAEWLCHWNYLTHVANAVVIVDGAILSAEAEGALARVMVAQVDTGGAVLARIEIFGAELNLLIAVSAC